MDNYESVIIDYINDHNITAENIFNVIKYEGYVNFFNDITIGCLGQPNIVHNKRQQTTSSIVYLPELVKERLITNFSIVYISHLYYGIMSNGFMPFNYSEYSVFLESLYNLRMSLKKRINENVADKQTKVVEKVIKMYMVSVYGMLDNSSSILSSEITNPREFVVKKSIEVLLEMVSFFANKSCPVYYINIDEMFVPYVDGTLLKELQQYFQKNGSKYTNVKISNVNIDDENRNLTGYILAKRKMMYGDSDSINVKGFRKVDNKKLLVQNKKYFGRNYKDIFPEYAIW